MACCMVSTTSSVTSIELYSWRCAGAGGRPAINVPTRSPVFTHIMDCNSSGLVVVSCLLLLLLVMMVDALGSECL